ncbi:MAG: tripartite tricarboxylate transporter permease [Chloroflexi bacterium]|nr:tripartite tricarboxylate transporter permease [Chloroflexota bacterium]
MLEAFAQAVLAFGDAQFLVFMLGGIVVGLIAGVIPGLNGLMATALFLPFVFILEPEQALPFMVALSSVSVTGGSITAVLLNIPGQETNAATLIDGFPMAQKGEAGRALGAALMSSMFGGIITVFFVFFMLPFVVPMVMSIRSPDMFFIIILGLAFVGVLGRGSMLKGLISGALGLLISLIGYQMVTAVPRFTFGNAYFYDGIGMVPFALGLFAIPEAFTLASTGGTIARTGVIVRGMASVWEGAKDVFRHWKLALRSSIIGYIVGVVPGIGSLSACFLAYGQAKQTSKNSEKYGTGIVEGVIAPETANNAVHAGALLTTLALGIPGSSVMTFLLAAFLMLEIIPGPKMMTEHLGLSLNLFLVIIVANILGSFILMPLAPHMAKVSIIPARILAPIVLAFALVGVFVYRGFIMDVNVAIVVGAMGIALRKFGFNRPAIFLGFILGSLFEKYLFISLQTEGLQFIFRPSALATLLILVALFGYRWISEILSRQFGRRRHIS